MNTTYVEDSKVMPKTTAHVFEPLKRLRVGIIGAIAERGWARIAHIPAIQAVPALMLQAVATRSEQTARAAAVAFGASLSFGSAAAMIAHKEVDLVVVAVKAPDHFDLVEQALQRGKPVYCEWPLGRTLAETCHLEEMARKLKVTTAVGLQGRFSPWLRQVREILETGRIGHVLSTSLIAYDEISVGLVDRGNAYMLDVANGANSLTIHAGHYIDSLCFVLGEMKTVSAVLATSRPMVVVRQTGATIVSNSPDQIAVSALLGSGGVASVHIRAGTGDPSVLWEIQGDKAVLRVSASGHLMWRPLKVELWDAVEKRWERIAPPDLVNGWDGLRIAEGPAQHVAYAYGAFAEDVLTGSRRSVSFSAARQRHETVEAISAAAREGVAKQPAGVARGPVISA